MLFSLKFIREVGKETQRKPKIPLFFPLHQQYVSSQLYSSVHTVIIEPTVQFLRDF